MNETHHEFHVVVSEPDGQSILTKKNQMDISPVNHVLELLSGDLVCSSRKMRILGTVETRPVEDTSVAMNDHSSTREHTEPRIAKYTMDDWHDRLSREWPVYADSLKYPPYFGVYMRVGRAAILCNHTLLEHY